MKRCSSRQVAIGIVGVLGKHNFFWFEIFLELAEMDVQKEEVQRLEKELSEAEEILEKEKTKSKGRL